MNPPIPFVDLAAQHAECEPELSAAISRVVASQRFVLGPELEAFEQGYAEVCGVKHCVGVGNGTDALELALRSLDITSGEVVVPALTFAATAFAVLRAGAVPVFADVDPDTLLIDPDRLPVTSRTRAIIAVHLYGQCAPIERLPSHLPIIEDAAQAHGAARFGQPAGSLGTIAASSFYPSKNLGALGDGGAVLTRYRPAAVRLRELRNHGGTVKYRHDEVGFNSRLDELQAAVLRVKLAHLDGWNEQRRRAALVYDGLCDEAGIWRTDTLPGNLHARHLYVVRVSDRDRVAAEMAAAGIEVGVHYPQALTQLPALAEHVRGACPLAEQASREVLSLPMWPGITPSQQNQVVSTLQCVIPAQASR